MASFEHLWGIFIKQPIIIHTQECQYIILFEYHIMLTDFHDNQKNLIKSLTLTRMDLFF